ncbi:hypothetical protein BKA69DRAFT_1035988 [Paraphysoderma sedebokerense]|nr:hypothetical protein BKA69DRAFT_1036462 [Paraphysoderma sedebokerense]KAI9144427.1 hypothetical protein BKA69DRAFT_1035988 [Paraphysoderma sedebokerense]
MPLVKSSVLLIFAIYHAFIFASVIPSPIQEPAVDLESVATAGATDSEVITAQNRGPLKLDEVTFLHGFASLSDLTSDSAHSAGPKQYDLTLSTRAIHYSNQAASRLISQTLGLISAFISNETEKKNFAKITKEFYVLGVTGVDYKVRLLDGSVSGGDNVVINVNKSRHFGVSETKAVIQTNAKEGLVKIEYEFGDKKDEIEPIVKKEGYVQLIGRKGWSVISDIDDTIRHTNVLNPLEAIQNTLVRTYVPTDLKELYAHFTQVLSTPTAPVAFHYVSGSIFQLTNSLYQFIEKYYPLGSVFLREFHPTSLEFWSQGTQKHKLEKIEMLITRFGERDWVLVGDSGEVDPETYGIIARKYPDQVKCIYIRKLTFLTPEQNKTKNDPQRFEKALEGIPTEKVVLFENSVDIASVNPNSGKCGV